MNFQTFQYIKRSISIVLNNFVLLLFPVSAGYYFYIPDPKKADLEMIMGVFIFLIAYMPIAYGFIFEKYINGNKPVLFMVFRKHWGNVITVTILLLLTGVLISNLILRNVILQVLFLFFAKICTLYIIPLVYFKGAGFNTIMLGLKCFFGNINFNMPLVILFFIPLLFAGGFMGVSGQGALLIHMAVCFIEFFINFVIFTSAVLILKDKVIE